MKKYLRKKIILTILFIIISFGLLAVTFPVMKMGLFPKHFAIDLCYVLAISVLCFILPLTVQEISQIFILLIEFLILIASASLYLSRGDVFNWDLLGQIEQLKAVKGMVKFSWANCIGGIALILVYIIACIFIKSDNIKLKKFYNLVIISIEVACLAICSVGNVFVHKKITTGVDDDSYFLSDNYMYDSFVSSYASLQKFGFYGFYLENLTRKLIPSTSPKVREIPFKYEHYTSILNGLCKDFNVIMIYAESFDSFAISKELTPTLYALKNGINLSSTGINKFYNVEKIDGKTTISRKDFNFNGSSYIYNGTDIYNGLITEEVGLNLANYKSKESTSYSECKALTGDYCDLNYTLPNILKDYESFYIHGNYSSFYHRNEYMKYSMGFKNTAFLEDMSKFAIGSLDSLICCSMDSETMRYYTDNPSEYNCFPTDKNFFTFFMTITTHGPYIYSSYLEDNYNFIDAVSNSSICNETFNAYNTLDDEFKNIFKEYYARVLDTEKAVTYIVNYLFENNLLDKTILTLTGDHDAYGLGKYRNLYNENYNKNLLDNCSKIDNQNIEGFIYSTKITSEFLNSNNESRIVKHSTESVDLPPTILTLLGREYTQDIFMGSAVINKSVNNPEKTVYNKLLRSYFYGWTESDRLTSITGQKISPKDSNYSPSQEEIDEFIEDYNYIYKKYYYVKHKR